MFWRQVVRVLRRALLLSPLVIIWLWAGVFLLPNNPPRAIVVPVVEVTAPDVQTEKQPLIEESTVPPSRPWFMKNGVRWPGPRDRSDYLFPKDSAPEDRIIEQLMYTLENDENASVKKILLANGPGAWNNINLGSSAFAVCPVKKCALQAGRNKVLESDAILFKDHYVDVTHGGKFNRPSHQVWIMYYLECPYHTPLFYTGDFNWTATYRRDSDIVAPYEKWVYYDPPLERPFRNYAANKTKKVAWFVSNCHARNDRLGYAKALGKYIPVDIYGACGTNRCPRSDPHCLEMLNKDYKFYLAFENSNCKDYITEKFFVNGLGHDVVPVAMGARKSDYVQVAPRNSFIHVDDFNSPKELAEYLIQLDEDDELYNSYLQWKGTGEFINTYFWCRLCAMVHAVEAKNATKHYQNLGKWWKEGACVKNHWNTSEKSLADYENVDDNSV